MPVDSSFNSETSSSEGSSAASHSWGSKCLDLKVYHLSGSSARSKGGGVKTFPEVLSAQGLLRRLGQLPFMPPTSCY